MTQLQQLTATVAICVCWGAVVLVWLIGALYNAVKGPTRDRRPVLRSIVGRGLALIVVVAAVVVVKLVPGHTWHSLRVDAPWVTFVGLATLFASAVFTLWARFTLGTMWTMDAAVKKGHLLRTEGPAASPATRSIPGC